MRMVVSGVIWAKSTLVISSFRVSGRIRKIGRIVCSVLWNVCRSRKETRNVGERRKKIEWSSEIAEIEDIEELNERIGSGVNKMMEIWGSNNKLQRLKLGGADDEDGPEEVWYM